MLVGLVMGGWPAEVRAQLLVADEAESLAMLCQLVGLVVVRSAGRRQRRSGVGRRLVAPTAAALHLCRHRFADLPPEGVDASPLLHTYQQLAVLTGIPISTLYTLVERRLIPHVRLGPRTVRFEPDAIEAWIEAGRVVVEAAP